MAIDLLDTPLRVTWDLATNDGDTSDAVARLVAERLAEAQAFFVTLERTPLRHAALPQVIEILSAAGCQLLLTCSGSDDELAALDLLPGSATLLLEIGPFVAPDGVDWQRLTATCARLREHTVDYGLSLTPSRDRLALIGPLLQFCLEQGVTRFKLPNMRINANFPAAASDRLVRPEDVRRFRELAADFPAFQGRLQLDVHDLFLWEILFPDGGTARSEYGGCQAGNSLAHVDTQGIVHPCVSWPQPLGSLLEETFSAIWQSPARHAVRDEISAQPDGCSGCRDYALCFGGCRGLARLEPDLQGRDPMCDGVRK